jgi:hypothetical protein
VSLEQGYYEIYLQPGWYMEKVEGDSSEVVEAQLLSSEWQSVYVYPHSSSWAEYHFGIGTREVWLNGELTIGVQVHEDPAEYYGGGCGGYGTGGSYPMGYGGTGCYPGSGGTSAGMPSGGMSSGGGWSAGTGGAAPASP